jgi:hypothetical protein
MLLLFIFSHTPLFAKAGSQKKVMQGVFWCIKSLPWLAVEIGD